MAARDQLPESVLIGTEEAIAKAIQELLTPKEDNLYTVTDITPKEIFSLCYMKAFNSLFDSPRDKKMNIVDEWLRKFLLLRISRLRLGRRELFMLSVGAREAMEERKRLKARDVFAGLR
jgi:hypothetical protein